MGPVTVLDAQLGYVDESVYGTPVVVSRFAEFNSESLQGNFARVEGEGMRAGTRVQRSDRYTPYTEGAEGDIEFEVMTKGFGFWLKHMLGSVASAAPAGGEVGTYTGTIGTLLGKSFTAQVGRPLNPTGTVQPFTYHGGKVTSWELSNSAEENLMCSLSCDFEDEDTTTALAAASYPTLMNPLSWVGGLITIGGTNVDVTEFSVKCENGLKTDRRYIRRNPLKKEPVEQEWRNIEFSLGMDFENTTQRARVASLIRASNLATLTASWLGPIMEGTSTFPELTVTIPAARFDSHSVNVDGPEALEAEVSGRALFDGAASAITVAYKTLDTTP